MEFGKPDTVIYTNIGNSKEADQKLRAAGGEHYFKTETIIQKSHERGFRCCWNHLPRIRLHGW